MDDDDGAAGRNPGALLRGATEEFFDRLASLADVARRTGGAAVGELPGPLPAVAAELLASVRTLASSMPAPSAPLELLLEEIGAKRALVRAMQEQLASFDAQLAVLERSLEPLREWSQQWERASSALREPLRRTRD